MSQPPLWCFPGGTGSTEPAVQETRESGVQSQGQEDPLQEGMATHLVFSPGESHGQKNLVGYGPRGHKETHVTEAA